MKTLRELAFLVKNYLLLSLATLTLWGVNTALAGPINLAHLYGSATTNAHYSTHTADLAIDNDTSTAWVAPNHGTIGTPNWLIVDLGSEFLVHSIDLYWQEPDGNYAGYTTNYNLHYATNNSAWNLLASGVFVDETDQISASFSFAPQLMRYVQYEVDGGSHWSSIAELRVWGEGDPIPEPGSLALLGFGLLALRRRVFGS